MGTTYIDAILLSHLSVALSQEERHGAFVHRWPIGVGTKTKQQLEDAGVGLRTDMPLDIRWLVGLARPWHQAPVLIVDEDAAELHRWCLLVAIAILQAEAIEMLRLGIRPPFPRRYAQQSGNFQDAVGESVVVATFYI